MDNQFEPFLKKQFDPKPFRVYPLAGDASNRRYFRVVSSDRSWVLMVWEPFDPENYPFLSVLNHFKKNKVNVPEVLALSASEGLVLLEDLGDLTLERKFWESQNQESCFPFYQMAIDQLIQIHFAATKDKSSCTAHKIEFDTAKLLWEMNYGLENLLKGICRFEFAPALETEVVKIFTDICERLHREPKFIAHRDYHSRNLMIKLDEMRVIDFQDARLGPIQYDLVSLMKDSYVNMSDAMANQLLEDYLVKAEDFLPKDFSKDHFFEIYEMQSIQRCFKACGSFSSFFMQRKDTRYLKYISPTLKRVLKSLSLFSQYKKFAEVLIDSGALERKYEVL